jgi:uncharacterized membrane protein YraQ (UPF0718 family)
MKERYQLALVVAVFAACWFLPVDSERFFAAVRESLALVRWYAREHVLLCLVPAFFIAGAISVFVSQGAVMKYLGPKANKPWPMVWLPCRGPSSPSARAPCSALRQHSQARRWPRTRHRVPLFRPAINVLAIILTARILGAELGIARAWVPSPSPSSSGS